MPPKAAQQYEPRYVVYHEFKDEKAALDWIGLNKVTNDTKGRLTPVVLTPGEYKLELRLPKDINRNLAHDLSGVVVGGIVICMFLPIFKMSELVTAK